MIVLIARYSITLLVPLALLNSSYRLYTRNNIIDKEKKEGRKEKKINKRFKLRVGRLLLLYNNTSTL